jgi:predicted dehydrogenase
MTEIAVAGAGLIGKRHIDAIRSAAHAGLACIVDPDPPARELANGLGVPYFPALEDMIAATAGPTGMAIDGVILATPNQLHVEGGTACIEARLPVLIEKPLAVDLEGARALVDAAEAVDVPLLTGHHRRHNPLIAAAKSAITSGVIGTPVSAHAMFWLFKPDDYFDVDWRRQPGAGPVYLNLSHDIDLLRHLVGEITAVTARESNAVRGNAVEETTVILVEFANGALGTVNVSDTIPAPWSWELTAGENPAYPHTDQACYQIGGTHGSIELPRNRIWQYHGERSWWKPLEVRTVPAQPGDPLVRQIDQFCAVIDRGEDPLVSGREGLRTLEVVDAVKQSAETGNRIVLAPTQPN